MKTAVLVDDLFFSSKISAAAKLVGAEIVFCSSAEAVSADATLICVDLNATTFDPIGEIRKLKAVRATPILAYVSHVQVNLKKQAEEAGADQVIPRSAFSERLPAILSNS